MPKQLNQKQNLKLNLYELICRRVFLPKNEKLKILNNCEEYIRENLSVEKMLLDSFKIEKIMLNYLKNEYIKECDFNKIPYHSYYPDNVKKIKKFERSYSMIRNIVEVEPNFNNEK